jgi:hypothetical protein
MDKEQRRAIRKYNAWQDKVFARNAKKGWRFFQPDSVSLPTPRSARDAWGGTYTPQSEDDCNEETYTSWTIYAFIVFYIAFLIWREFP